MRRLDVVLAIGLTGLLQVDVWTSSGEGELYELKPLSSALMLLVTVPLAWRRQAPLAVAAANGFARVAQAVAAGAWVATPGLLFPTLVALYSVGAYARGPRAWLGFICIVAGVLAASAYDIPSTETDLWNGLFFYLLCLAVFAAGMLVRGRREAVELQRRAEWLERERADQERAVAEERARIARELHDVVAHSVSAAVVQAEAAEEVFDDEPDRARRSLVRIQDSGREAMGEMRRLLGIIRGDDDAGALSPQPRLADLERLVEEAGVAATLTVEGTPRALSPGVELSGYRIVQEALTNVRKHAGRSARAAVVVRYADASLDLEIADDGGGPGGHDGRGHGLIGMRERVTFFGGEFSAGEGEQGGFVVRARFALPAPQP